MGLQDSFDVLSRVVEAIESRGRTVRDMEVTTNPDSDDTLDVRMTLPVSLCPASSGSAESTLTPQSASVTEAGQITVTCSVSELLPDAALTDAVIITDTQSVRVEDSELIVTADFQVGPAQSRTTRASPVEETDVQEPGHPDGEATFDSTDAGQDDDDDDDDGDRLSTRLAAARSEDVPAYDDTRYLTLLYESCETFTEMSEYIEMDVAAETVRRYMIEAGIHEPSSYDSATETETETDGQRNDPTGEESESAPTGASPAQPAAETLPDEQLLTDGIGLPDGVTVADLVDTVVDATAVYEVQRSLGLDHGQTRELLQQLNVLDLVLHRIDGPADGASKDDVVQRIQQCTVGEV